jgi:GxxExxY protein
MRDPLDEVTEQIIGAAIDVHRELGPGLLESAYDVCLAFELLERRLAYERQKDLPIVYRGHRLNCGYRLDFLVERQIVVELKSIERFEPVHTAQVLSYLRLAKLRVGLLINFHVRRLREGGVKRIVNGFRV